MIWHLNELCNFSCSYCYFENIKQEHPAVGRLSPQEIKDAFDHTGRKWHLFLTGGEPMLYPNFNELVSLLKPNNPIQISTNLYHKNVKQFAQEVTPENIITINVSLHIMHHNNRSLEKLIDNYHLLREKGFDIIMSYVTHPKLFSRIENDFDLLHKEGVEHVFPLTYFGEYNGKQYPASYTLDQARLIRKLYQEPLELHVMLQKMKWLGQQCSAGKDYFHMDLHGEVSRCCTIPDQTYGNLYNKTFTPAKSDTPCTAENCMDHCHGMMSVVPEPQPIELPEIGFFEKQYRSLRSVFSKDDIKVTHDKLQAVPKEDRDSFIRK